MIGGMPWWVLLMGITGGSGLGLAFFLHTCDLSNPAPRLDYDTYLARQQEKQLSEH